MKYELRKGAHPQVRLMTHVQPNWTEEIINSLRVKYVLFYGQRKSPGFISVANHKKSQKCYRTKNVGNPLSWVKSRFMGWICEWPSTGQKESNFVQWISKVETRSNDARFVPFDGSMNNMWNIPAVIFDIEDTVNEFNEENDCILTGKEMRVINTASDRNPQPPTTRSRSEQRARQIVLLERIARSMETDLYHHSLAQIRHKHMMQAAVPKYLW